MGKRGPKPEGKVRIKWSRDFAYAVGLLVTDGNLSKNGRHISFVSKDFEQIKTFMKCLGIRVVIGSSFSGYKKIKTWRVQFGDVLFHKWLMSTGIIPRKSKTLGIINIPQKYFIDFFRGCFDGDGCSYSYWDPRWKSSFMFYLSLASGSLLFLQWIKKILNDEFSIVGHITQAYKHSVNYQLRYSKHEAVKLVKRMYARKGRPCLQRKKLKISQSFVTMGLPALK